MTRWPLLVVWALTGCGDDRHSPPDAAQLPDASADGDAAAPLTFVSGPTITLPSSNAPLTGLLALSTSRPTRLSLAITDDNRAFTIEWHTLATEHSIPVLGLRAGTTHTVIVTATDELGMTATAEPITVATATLPVGFPMFSTNRAVPAQIEPGITVFGMSHYVIAVDDDGKVVWFVNLPRGTEDVRMLSGGTIILELNDHITAEEIDVFGMVLRQWHAANTTTGQVGSVGVAVDSFHHELDQLPDGNFLVLSTERRVYNNYPTSETDPTPQTSPQAVVGDQVVVFAPDGTVVHRFPMLDVADPYRLGYGSFGNFWSAFYTPTGAIDWSHSNAVFPDPSDGGYLVSVRHQDAMFKLDASGALQWILGTPDNWDAAHTPYLLTPVGTPFLWPFHQHAPHILGNGHIMVFDNGNFRVSPPAPKPATNYSRAVEYAVDPVQKQVRQVWTYDAGQAIYAQATGDIDVGPVTGNVIVTFGGASQIVEVTHEEPPVVVFTMSASQTFYRSERMKSLYPAD